MKSFQLTPTMKNIVGEISRLGGTSWVVGGAIRDRLLNKEPKDLDFATNYDHNALEMLVRQMGLVYLPDQKAHEHGIVRVVDKDTGEIIDIAKLRRDDETDGRYAKVVFTNILTEDLARRDICINAMAVEIHLDGTIGKIIDPFNGQQDIKDKQIRYVGNPDKRIEEDALRMIRACRFTALGDNWTLTHEAQNAIKRHANEIKTISAERIRDEIIKGLSYDCPSNFFRILLATGLLVHIFPDLAQGVGVGQNEYHSSTVFEHLLLCLDSSVDLTDSWTLRLSCLTHDIAKPHTRSVDAKGRVHFYKHEVEGAALMYKWMRRFNFSRKDIEYVTRLVRHHQFYFRDDSKTKSIRKWLSAVGPDWKDLITLRCADRKGNLLKANRPMITQKMRELMQRAQNIIDSGAPIFREDLAITGDDLKKMGIKPGKIYSEIFSNLLGIMINDPSKNSKEWITQHVGRIYGNRNS